MTEKPYGMLMISFLNRDDQSERKVVAYPVTLIQVMDRSRGAAGKPRFTLVPNENGDWVIRDE